jgi:hypothetical protein
MTERREEKIQPIVWAGVALAFSLLLAGIVSVQTLRLHRHSKHAPLTSQRLNTGPSSEAKAIGLPHEAA